jgi:signal transduction histidine kinase
VLSAKSIALQFYAPNLDKEFTINTNIRREVFLIFKESINNVVKHSGASQTRIELALTSEELTLEISDNGDGFEPESTTGRLKPNLFSSKDETGGNGILSMQKRALEMNGKFEINSGRGRGTSVMLILPLQQTAQTGGDFQK